VTAPAPQTLGRYEIEGEIGRGTMGVVYRAFDPALGRTVALKTVQLAFSLPPEEAERFQNRFVAEARVAAGLSHPGIVTVHDVGRDPSTGMLFIALEYLEGRTLDEMTANGTAMECAEALRVAARLARALHHAHSKGVVHRDIKPANIMVLPNGEPKIMDFGIAKVPAAQLTTAGEFFGTPSYMSPEQACGEPLDGRSDLFSLGAVLFLLLTGQRAFHAATVPAIMSRVMQHDPPEPSQLTPGLSEDVDYIVRRALAKSPESRYPDGNTLAEDLEDCLLGRAPRHRSVWKAPAGGDFTQASAGRAIPSAGQPFDRAKAPKPKPSLGTAAKRGLLAVAALLFLCVATAFWLGRDRRVEPPDLPVMMPSLQGHLEVHFEHSLKSGTIKVWIDDVPLIEQPLESQVTKKILSLKMRKGSLRRTVDVSPGLHVIRVEVRGDGYNSSRWIQGTFNSGSTRRLEVSLPTIGGLLRREISLDWIS